MNNWTPPSDWLTIKTIDAHAAGEPLRVIVHGIPHLQGDSILARRQYLKKKLDHLRKILMWEPRGHADMYGCILTPPVSQEADLGVLFLHNEGYSTMCGHGIIALTTVALQTGMLPAEEGETTVKFDTPAGLVTAQATVEHGIVKSVRFHNVPSFVVALDQKVDVPELGKIKYDLAFGGAFYAYVKASDAGVSCLPRDFRQLIEKGTAIKRAVAASRAIEHPYEPDLGFLYGTIFISEPQSPLAHSRNVCVFAEGEVDRSPTGTGVSGRLAIHHARGEIAEGDPIEIESIIGSKFIGRVVRKTMVGPYSAIIPEVEGTASITGMHTFVVDPDDPFGAGFILR